MTVPKPLNGPAENFDVAIIGYGPTGATLGHLLGLCGVKTLILDRENAAYHLPRAVHFDDEVMRTFQTIGLSDLVSAKVRVNPGMRFVDTSGKLLLDWPRPQTVSPMGWFASYRFHQPDLEHILRHNMASRTSVTVRTRCDVTSVSQSDSYTKLIYKDLTNQKTKSIHASYIIGCDGARSMMRAAIGSDMHDFGFRERWLVVDLLLRQDKPSLGDHSIQFCNPDRPSTYVRCPENRRRWEISLRTDETSEQMVQPQAVWHLLKPWLTSDEADIERAAVYTFHSLVAKQWRKGRFLLAGDAAHQTPPFMGQGMCAGIRDVANLAWKLALVVQNKTPPDILDSYQSEREPNAQAYISTAVRLGGLINTCNTKDALKTAFVQANGSARMESIAPPLGSGIGVGPMAGHLFAQPRLADGSLLDDLVGYRSCLLVKAPFAPNTHSAMDYSMITTDQAPNLMPHLNALNATAVLVRPDRFVQAVAETPQDIASLVTQALPSPLC